MEVLLSKDTNTTQKLSIPVTMAINSMETRKGCVVMMDNGLGMHQLVKVLKPNYKHRICMVRHNRRAVSCL